MAALTLDEIAVRTLDAVLAEVPSSAAALFILDDTDGRLCLQTQHGGNAATFADLPTRVPSPLALPAVLFDPASGNGFLAVPLRARNRFCGVAAVAAGSEPKLTARQRARLSDIGDRAGELIEWAALVGDLEHRAGRLQAVYRAGLEVSSELELSALLQSIADIARDLLGARYAALGVTNQDGVIQQFFTSGISQAERERIGPLPQGKGLLGAIIKERRLIRLPNIHVDPRSYGFPPHHPAMSTFIGTPISRGTDVLGDLYVTEKQDGEFTEEDEVLISLLAAQAAIAIENARLYQQVGRIAVLEERERIAMDLHDDIIQSIYGVGLGLEDLKARLTEEPPAALEEHVERAVGRLEAVVRDIRAYIGGLQSGEKPPLAERIEGLLGEFGEADSPLSVSFAIHAEAAERLSPAQGESLINVLHEALSNARRHAGAGKVEVSLAEEQGRVLLRVRDDGVGFDAGARSTGNGLHNMRERAIAGQGSLRLESKPGQGTTVILDLPLARP